MPSSGTFTLTASATNHYFSALTETTGVSANDAATAGNFWGANFADLGPPPTGSLHVTLAPSGAVTAGARWNVDGGAWQTETSGATVSGLALGGHTVYFNTVAGWNSPDERAGDHRAQHDDVPHRHLRATDRQPAGDARAGRARSPPERSGIVDGGAWQNSGATVNGLLTGVSHTVNYNTVAGWNSPPSAPAPSDHLQHHDDRHGDLRRSRPAA